MRVLLWLALCLVPLGVYALPAAQCLPVPMTPTEMHWECSSTGCVVFWACPNADGTWGSYAAWGHTNEVAASAAQLVFYATEAYYGNLTLLNTALTQVVATTDDYSDLQPLFQDLAAKYEPPNPATVFVAPSGTLTTRPTYLWSGTSSTLSNRVAVGSPCNCTTLQVGTSPKYCSVAGDKGADGSTLPANTIAACQ